MNLPRVYRQNSTQQIKIISLELLKGERKNWNSFVKDAYLVARNEDERSESLFSILEPIKSFGDKKSMEKWDFKVFLSIECITIRDVNVELCAKFRDHPFWEPSV